MSIQLPPNHHVTRRPYAHLKEQSAKNDNARYKDSGISPLKQRLQVIAERVDTQVRHPQTSFHYDSVSFQLGHGSVAVLRVNVVSHVDETYHDFLFDPNQLYHHPDPLVVLGYFCEQLMGGGFDCTALRNIYRTLTAVMAAIAHTLQQTDKPAYRCYYGQRKLVFVHTATQATIVVTLSDFFGR